ncbi:hypothetical protein D5086_005185 [Populus alba]|uniref:Uncharacterized protein n=1 Tax=Populus alba TaxID=43335 RepID=A0ACC4CSW1_POPAL
MAAVVTYLVIFTVISSALAYDPDMLQDLCVANTSAGELDVGFITTANKLISKTVKKGEVFVFPRGLVHFQKNNDDKAASVISAFNSQLPGTQSIAMTLFTSTPAVPDNVLTKAFQVGTKEIDKIKTKLAPKKS